MKVYLAGVVGTSIELGGRSIALQRRILFSILMFFLWGIESIIFVHFFGLKY